MCAAAQREASLGAGSMSGWPWGAGQEGGAAACVQGMKLGTVALGMWLSQAPGVSVGLGRTPAPRGRHCRLQCSPAPARPRLLAPHTSDLCVVRYAHDAVGVIGGGGDLSRTASAVSAAKDEDR